MLASASDLSEDFKDKLQGIRDALEQQRACNVAIDDVVSAEVREQFHTFVTSHRSWSSWSHRRISRPARNSCKTHYILNTSVYLSEISVGQYSVRRYVFLRRRRPMIVSQIDSDVTVPKNTSPSISTAMLPIRLSPQTTDELEARFSEHSLLLDRSIHVMDSRAAGLHTCTERFCSFFAAIAEELEAHDRRETAIDEAGEKRVS